MIKSEWDRLIKEREDFKESVLAEHGADIVNEPKPVSYTHLTLPTN